VSGQELKSHGEIPAEDNIKKIGIKQEFCRDM
jgi:hypothetical protein